MVIALTSGLIGAAVFVLIGHFHGKNTATILILSIFTVFAGLVFGSLTAAVAARKGRAPLPAFFIGVFFNLVGILFLSLKNQSNQLTPVPHIKFTGPSIFIKSLVSFLLLEIILIELDVHFIIPWWTSGAAISDLESLRTALSLLLYGSTAVNASLSTSIALSRPNHLRAVRPANLIAIPFSIFAAFGIGIAINYVLSETLVTGPVVTHLFAALLGFFFSIIVIFAGSSVRKHQILAVTLVFVLFFSIFPSPVFAASSSDINPSDCTRLTEAASFDASLTIFSVYAGPQFNFAISETADGQAKLAVTTGLQAGFDIDFIGGAEKIVQEVVGSGVKANLKAGGNVALKNTYMLPSRSSAEKLVSRSLGSYAAASAVFPGLGWSVPAPVAPALSAPIETDLDLDTGVELNLGVSILGADFFKGSIHPQDGVVVRMKNDHNLDSGLVSDPASVDIGFHVAGAGGLTVANRGMSGDANVLAFITFQHVSTSLGVWLPKSASLEVSGKLNKSTAVSISGLIPFLGLEAGVNNGQTFDVLANLQSLDNKNVVNAISILVSDLAANAAKGSVPNPPSASDVNSALKTVIANSDVAVTFGKIISAQGTIDFSFDTGFTFGISADGSLTVTELQKPDIGGQSLAAAYDSAAGSNLHVSSTCTPFP